MVDKVTCINCRQPGCTGCKGDGVPVPPTPIPPTPIPPTPINKHKKK